MNQIRLTKKQCEMIDKGIQIEFSRKNIYMYAVAEPYGEWTTPAGTRFSVNFYAPSKYDLDVFCNGELLNN